MQMASGSRPKKRKSLDLFAKIENDRAGTAKSVLDFEFNKSRIRVLSNVDEVSPNARGILYWMFRDARVQDNWAFLFAQKIALKNSLPLHVCFCILPKFLDATIRHYKFLLKGLVEVESECKKLNINFHLLQGEPNNVVLKFVKDHKMGAVVIDFFPLRLPMSWVNDLKEKLPEDVPLCQVDAHNIVPCWITSDKQEYAARTIRNKINSKLSDYLTQFPPIIKHPHTKGKNDTFPENNFETALNNVQVDRSVDEVHWIADAGYRGGIKTLEDFVQNRLQEYYLKRNDPLLNVQSNLSPWFHFGMISIQRCILECCKYKKEYKESVEAFMEEAIVRRELSDNFCYYNEYYDSLKGAPSWAFETLDLHRHDLREYMYNLKEFENSLTHDDLWNSAQIQLVKEGKMHGFLRMYWAKKILDWAPSPEDALKWAIYLNDKYSMDGRDPNGYVGCMWSICGLHDQGWKERMIFGKIRYMNYKGCERKFDVKEFVKKWGGKIHGKKGKK